jgi:hypothetical protein
MSKFENLKTGIVVSVDDSKDERFTSGWKAFGAESATARSEKPDKTWKNDDLKSYAAENGIDLGDATKKEDFLAAIELHQEALSKSE